VDLIIVPRASSSTVADQVCAFESRKSRNGESRQQGSFEGNNFPAASDGQPRI